MKKKTSTILFILYSVLVFTVSSIPRLSVSVYTPVISPDKLAHCFQYFIFAFLYFHFRFNQKKFNFVKRYNNVNKYDINHIYEVIRKDIYVELFFLSFLISIFDELHQIPIPGREFCWFDVIADILGIQLFILFSAIYYKNFNLKKEKAV